MLSQMTTQPLPKMSKTMSKFSLLENQLTHYKQLTFHTDPAIAKRLADVQHWQKERMQYTHADFFAQPEHHLMSRYFLNRLYGGPDFEVLAGQIARVIKYAHKVEKIMPASAIQTGNSGVQLAVLAVELDEQVAIDLLAEYGSDQPITDEMMRVSYLKLDQAQARNHQLDLLDELGKNLDKYMRSFIVQSAFKMAKGLAYRHHFDPMYEFMQEGFEAMKPLDSAADFVKVFSDEERRIIARVHSGEPRPFVKEGHPPSQDTSQDACA